MEIGEGALIKVLSHDDKGHPKLAAPLPMKSSKASVGLQIGGCGAGVLGQLGWWVGWGR